MSSATSHPTYPMAPSLVPSLLRIELEILQETLLSIALTILHPVYPIPSERFITSECNHRNAKSDFKADAM
jgi:hypothetical protein